MNPVLGKPLAQVQHLPHHSVFSILVLELRNKDDFQFMYEKKNQDSLHQRARPAAGVRI